MEKEAGPDGPVVSVTTTKKGYVPQIVGVPEIVPLVGSNVRPGGNKPPAIDQEQGQTNGTAIRTVV